MKLRQIRIESFRGIAASLEVDCRNLSGVSSSVIITGDNGSGKSSIVDAVEFALQAKISGSQRRQNPDSASPLSLASTSPSQVKVTFEDGSEMTRELSIDVEGKLQFDGIPHRSFAFAPIALRRSDILRFWDTPDIKKQVIFFGHFRGSGVDSVLGLGTPVADQLQELESRRISFKQQRREMVVAFAKKAGVPAEEVPLEPKQFLEFVRNVVYGGLTSHRRKVLESKGMRVRVNTDLEHLWKEIKDTNDEIGKIQRKCSELRKQSEVPPSGVRRTVAEGLVRVGEFVTAAFRRLSPSRSFVDEIRLEMGTLSDVSLQFAVHMKNGMIVEPRKIFSEANLDLLALLMFLGVCRESAERGQARLLVLDDVLQSVDSGIRAQTVEYMLEELRDWQFFITVHDRLWREQLRNLFNRANHPIVEKEILGWTFQDGPRIITSGFTEVRPLLSAIEDGTPQSICLEAGVLLERISNMLSYSLPIAVTRRRDDKYTLGDLWPGVSKVLRKTSIRVVVDSIDRWLHLRNLVGAHYNEWAALLSREEAVAFGKSVT